MSPHSTTKRLRLSVRQRERKSTAATGSSTVPFCVGAHEHAYADLRAVALDRRLQVLVVGLQHAAGELAAMPGESAWQREGGLTGGEG